MKPATIDISTLSLHDALPISRCLVRLDADAVGGERCLFLGLDQCLDAVRSEEHTSELQSQSNLVCRLLLEKKKHTTQLQSQSNLVCRLLLEKNKQSPHVFIHQ